MIGNEIVFDEIARGTTHQQFVFAEGRIEMEKIETLEFEAHEAPAIL